MVYKLKISYDGSFFCGYAKQNNVITVQGELEKELSLLFNEKIKTISSGRTDKYVHALDQTVHFKSKLEINLENIRHYLNDKLEHIYVKNVSLENESFHSRFSIKEKTYLYVINTGEFNLFKQRYEHQYNKFLDIKKAKEIVQLFIGKKDFKSFSTSELDNSIREITNIKIIQKNNKILFFISGKGFLRNMVRMIVACFINYCEGKIDKKHILYLLNNPKKGSSISKAPGCGLYLYKTIY